MKAPKLFTMDQATPTQHKLLKKYAVLMVRRSNLMIGGKDHRKSEMAQDRVYNDLLKSGFNMDRLYIALYDLGYEADAIQRTGGLK